MDARIRRSERLKSKRAIDRLFRKGERFKEGKILMRSTLEGGSGKMRFGIGVPKKKLRKAHQRNRTKRLMREALRPELGKVRTALFEQRMDADLFFLYQDGKIPAWKDLQGQMIRLLERWQRELEKRKAH